MVRKSPRRAGRGQEALPKGWEGSGRPPGGLVGVRRPSRRARRGWESTKGRSRRVWEGWEGSASPSRGPGEVGSHWRGQEVFSEG